MRSVAILILLVFSLSFVYTGCKEADEVIDKSEQLHEQSKQEFDSTISDKAAPEVWGLIQTEDYKLRWKMWPGKQNVYVNPIAQEAIENRESEFPIGSIIVQEVYSDQENLEKVKVAYRIGGNEATNGWFGADYKPGGVDPEINNNVQNLKP